MTVPQDLKDLVEKKLAKLDKYFYDEADATVTFSRRRNKERLEVTINASSTLFRSEAEEATFRDALDRDIDSIERQIRKYKTKLDKRIRPQPMPDAVSPSDPEPEETDFVIHKKSFYFKPMSPEEAILQMNLLGHQFFMFEDQDSGATCVVYTRKDGAYGLIVPEKE